MTREIRWHQKNAVEVRLPGAPPILRLGFEPHPRPESLANLPVGHAASALALPMGILPLVDHAGIDVDAARLAPEVSALAAEIVLGEGHEQILHAQDPGAERERLPALILPGTEEQLVREVQRCLGVIPGVFVAADGSVTSLGPSFGAPIWLHPLPRILLAAQDLLADNTDVSVSMGVLLQRFVEQFSGPEDALPHVRVATGYLYGRGLLQILGLLRNPRVESLRLLFSGRTDKRTATALTALLEERLAEGAEEARDDLDLWPTLTSAVASGRLQVRVYTDAFLHAKLFLAYDKYDTYKRLKTSRAVVGSSNLSASGLTDRGNLELDVTLHGQAQNTQLVQWFDGRWEEAAEPVPALLEVLQRQTPAAPPEFQTEGLEVLYQEGLAGHLETPTAHLELLASLYGVRLDSMDIGDEPVFPHDPERSITPTPEQVAGVEALVARLLNVRLAFLADSVGLGKTITAIGAAWYLERTGKAERMALIAPRKLWDQWGNDAALVGAPSGLLKPLNRHLLERDEPETAAAKLRPYDLIVVDEAHEALRNRNNRLWVHLRAHLRAQRQCRLLLVSATPWNNRREDILNYLLLAWNDGHPLCGSYPWLGMQPLAGMLRSFMIQPAGVLPAAAAVRWFADLPNDRYRQAFDNAFVQRSRSAIAKRYGAAVDFPARQVHPHTTPAHPPYDDLFAALKVTLSVLTVPFREPFSALMRADAAIHGGGGDLPESNLHQSYVIQLFKRAESSLFALAVSLANLERRLTDFEEQIQAIIETDSPHKALGAWLKEAYLRLDGDLEDEDLDTSSLTASEKTRLSNVQGLLEALYDEGTLQLLQSLIDGQVVPDLAAVRDLRSKLSLALEEHSPKEILLTRLARQAYDQGYKPILIAGYADTALRIFLRLSSLLPDASVGLALGGGEGWLSKPRQDSRSPITEQEWAESLLCSPRDRRQLLLGGAGRARAIARDTLLGLFAPKARFTPPESVLLRGGEVDILVGSEAIGVGQNLQDSTCLIHLDLPWNPMVIEQRIGRVDRRGGGRSADPEAGTGSIVDVHYCWSPKVVEDEVDLRGRLKVKAEGAMRDTNFDEILLYELREMVERARAQRGAASLDEVAAGVLGDRQRTLADAQAQVQGIPAGSGSELDALRVLASWRSDQQQAPARAPVVAAGMVAPGTVPDDLCWLLSLELTPRSDRGEPLTERPFLYHLALQEAPGAVDHADMEVVVRRLVQGGEPCSRPSWSRTRWTRGVEALDEAVQRWGAALVEAHNDEVTARLQARLTPAAQRSPSERTRLLADAARQALLAEAERIEGASPGQLVALEEKIFFLIEEVLAPAHATDLLADREEQQVEADLVLIKNYTRRFLTQEFDEVFERLCGERWRTQGAAEAVPDMLTTLDGRWAGAHLKLLGATWCET